MAVNLRRNEGPSAEHSYGESMRYQSCTRLIYQTRTCSTGWCKKNRNFEIFEGHFFEKTSFLGVKIAEKHDSGVKKIF